MNEIQSFKNFKKESNMSEKVNEQIHVGGPVVTPVKLPVEVVALLNTRLIDEYTAHYFYKNAANWCAGVNYKKAAAFFEGEAAAELTHVQGILDYIVAWNLIPAIPAVQTQVPFESLVDVVNKAYALELGLYDKYSKDLAGMLAVHPGTFNFLQTYVDYQTAEVTEYSDLLNALCLIDVNNKLDILHFEEIYF